MIAGRSRILIVDDEVAFLELLGEFFSDQDYEVIITPSGEQALELLDKNSFNVVITDLRMSPVDGLQILYRARERNPRCEIIMITGYASMDSSLAALRGKVFDYMEKPVNLEQLERTVQNALRKNSLALENDALLERLVEQNEQLEKQVEEATRELQDQTIKDYLTGLNNYRFFVNALTTEISRSVRYGRIVSLVMLDLDFFKAYNDCLGHLAGNHLLQTIARIIRSMVRENDLVARYGGEEFAIILPETSKKEAVPIIERLQDSIRAKNFSYTLSNGEKARLTISAGIASCPGDGDDFDNLVRAADAALYQAKSSGRDRLVLAAENKDSESAHEEN